MATTKEEGAVPDFLRMDAQAGSDAAKIKLTGDWHGWPHKDVKPVTLLDDEGRLLRIRTPVMDLEGLITPTDLHYTVQHFAVPEVVPADQWSLAIDGEVKNPLTLSFDDLRRFPGRSVRTVMECSGSDATFFEYFQDQAPRPSRTQECMILSASEWTGVPLAAVLAEAGLTDRSLYIRAEGWDKGLPPTAEEGLEPFFYDKGLACKRRSIQTRSWPGPRTASYWNISTVLRCGCWFPDGRATGRSSGYGAWKLWTTCPTAGTTMSFTTTPIPPTRLTRN